MSASEPHIRLADELEGIFDQAMQSSSLPFNERVNLRTEHKTALRRLEEQLEAERTRAHDFGAEADALEAKLAEMKEQLEAAQKVIDAARAAWRNDQDFYKLVAALREYDSNPATSPSYDFAGSAPDGHAPATQSAALGEGNDPASGADE